MKDIFIADAHLRTPDSEDYQQLLKFLRHQRGQIGTLVLLGDIFEFWVGYRHCVFSAYVPLLSELHHLHRAGTRIIAVEGNHDFHLGAFFSATLNCTIIADSAECDLGATTIHLCHGDTIAASGGYLWLRRFFRSWLARALIHILPGDVTWNIGAVLGNISKKRRHQKTLPPLPQQALTTYAASHLDTTCSAVICGHFHRNWRHTDANGELIILANWGSGYPYLEHQDGVFKLRRYSNS